MSAQDLDTSHSSDDHHDDHEVFDAEPATKLAADETPTPMWLPALGVVLFIAMGLFLAFSGDDEGGAQAKVSADAQASAAAAAKPPARPTAAAPTIRPLPQGLNRRDAKAPRPRGQLGTPRPGTRPNAALPGGGKVPSAEDIKKMGRLLRQQQEAKGLKPPPAR